MSVSTSSTKGLLLLAFFIAGLAACGQPPPESGEGDNGDGGGQTAAETTAQGAETTAEETTVSEVGSSPELAEAADEYEEYVVEQVALLEKRTEGFAGAVLAGDVEQAKKLYAPAREPWERGAPSLRWAPE